MVISNLNYLESVSEENLVEGGFFDTAVNAAVVNQNQGGFGGFGFFGGFGPQFQVANVTQTAIA